MDEDNRKPKTPRSGGEGNTPKQPKPKGRKKPSRSIATDLTNPRMLRITESHNRKLTDEGRKQEREAAKLEKLIAQLTVAWIYDQDLTARLVFLADIQDYATAAEQRLLQNSMLFRDPDAA